MSVKNTISKVEKFINMNKFRPVNQTMHACEINEKLFKVLSRYICSLPTTGLVPEYIQCLNTNEMYKVNKFIKRYRKYLEIPTISDLTYEEHNSEFDDMSFEIRIWLENFKALKKYIKRYSKAPTIETRHAHIKKLALWYQDNRKSLHISSYDMKEYRREWEFLCKKIDSFSHVEKNDIVSEENNQIYNLFKWAISEFSISEQKMLEEQRALQKISDFPIYFRAFNTIIVVSKNTFIKNAVYEEYELDEDGEPIYEYCMGCDAPNEYILTCKNCQDLL